MSKEEFIEYIRDYGCYKDKNGEWNCDTDLNIANLYLKYIPVRLNKVNGDFYCDYNELTSLYNCPRFVAGGVFCYRNKLTSLKYCPETINGNFYCAFNPIKDCSHNCKIGGKFSK